MNPADLQLLQEQVRAAAAQRRPLCIRAGGSKAFYGNTTQGEPLDPRAWQGIVSYEPSELVITARCGTGLAELEALLAEQRQMLAFEPPHFSSGTTVGGCVAAGLSGPRRAASGPAQGSIRDALLGAQLLDGNGRVLRFGGTVMKNVAGYDVSRVLAGSLGFLGVILEVSLKVVPMPAHEATVMLELSESAALQQFQLWMRQAEPVSATCWRDGRVWLRLSGSHAGVHEAAARLGGEALDADDALSFWRALRDHADAWFGAHMPLWRLSLPAMAEPLALAGAQTMEWGGALRWLQTSLPADEVQVRAQQLGGHATLFRGGNRARNVFAPLSPPIFSIHQGLKKVFDPAGIFNFGRLVPGL